MQGCGLLLVRDRAGAAFRRLLTFSPLTDAADLDDTMRRDDLAQAYAGIYLYVTHAYARHQAISVGAVPHGSVCRCVSVFLLLPQSMLCLKHLTQRGADRRHATSGGPCTR